MIFIGNFDKNFALIFAFAKQDAGNSHTYRLLDKETRTNIIVTKNKNSQ